ncbi:MAG: HAD family hydrolase [Phycisphaerae bacterium]|nr:HAD family hydrolase [Phycisphaerae bacterium]
MELDGVFMDMYGTITTGDRAAVEATCREIVKDTGVKLSAHELSITWGERFFHAMDFHNNDGFLNLFDLEAQTLIETMAALGVEIDPAPYVSRLSAYWQNPPLQPEVKEFLSAFRPPICIVSNADRADVEAALALHDIRVAGLVTSEDARSYKPDRTIFEDALRLTSWRRERVLHVGDSLHSDVGGALLAGLRSVWINRAHRIHDIGHIDTHKPDYECDDLMGLKSLAES